MNPQMTPQMTPQKAPQHLPVPVLPPTNRYFEPSGKFFKIFNNSAKFRGIYQAPFSVAKCLIVVDLFSLHGSPVLGQIDLPLPTH